MLAPEYQDLHHYLVGGEDVNGNEFLTERLCSHLKTIEYQAHLPMVDVLLAMSSLSGLSGIVIKWSLLTKMFKVRQLELMIPMRLSHPLTLPRKKPQHIELAAL